MRVAVLMSTYNGKKFIKEQIDSIISQKGKFELNLFVRDDGSTDGTIQVLKKYENNGELQFYKGKNLGPALSFLDLLKKYKGYDYYAFSDQDDYWEPNKIEVAIQKLRNGDRPGLYFSNAEVVDSELNFIGRKVYKKNMTVSLETLSCAGGVLGCTTLINSKLAKIIQEADCPRHIIMHDYYIAEVCLAVGGDIIYDPNTHMKYRQHENNVVGFSNGKWNIIKDRIDKIVTKSENGIDEQAKEILSLYGNDIDENEKEWLEQVADYKKIVINRLRLFCSRKIKCDSINSSVTIRLAILMGNR